LLLVVLGFYNVTYPKQVDINKQHDNNNNNNNNSIRNEKDDYENAMKLLNTIDEEIATTTTTTTVGDIQKCPFMHSVKKTKNHVSGQGKNRNPTTAYTAPWENDDNDDTSRLLLSSSSSTTSSSSVKKCHDKNCNHCDDDDVYETDYDVEYVQSKENNYINHYFLDSDHENNSNSSRIESRGSSSRGNSSGSISDNSSSRGSNGTRSNSIQVVKANKSKSSNFSIIDADERV